MTDEPHVTLDNLKLIDFTSVISADNIARAPSPEELADFKREVAITTIGSLVSKLIKDGRIHASWSTDPISGDVTYRVSMVAADRTLTTGVINLFDDAKVAAREEVRETLSTLLSEMNLRERDLLMTKFDKRTEVQRRA